VAAVILTACSSSTAATQSPSPTAPGKGCVSTAQARQVWTQIDKQLNAIELDPKHAGVANVATGQARLLINQYLQQQLVANNFTEREVDRLDALVVEVAGCGGRELQVRVTETVVTDDYLNPAGKVDHRDPAVGTTIHIRETLVRSGASWKESNFIDLDQPQPTQSPVVV